MLFDQRKRKTAQEMEKIPVAYPASLLGVVPAGALTTQAAPAPAQANASRGEALASRALGALAALEHAIAQTELPEVAVADLRGNLAAMAAAARDLGAEVDRLSQALAETPESADVSALHARLGRLGALERAGERVDPAERDRLERAIAAQDAAQEKAAELEAQLVSSTARLIEIAGAASRTRAEILLEGSRSADEAVARMTREARAALDARREAEAGARARQARQASRSLER
jgi:hypothetical protein